MKSKLYYLVRKILKQDQRNKLKLFRYSARKRLNDLRETIYGSFSHSELYHELKSNLPYDFDILMVHCSQSNLIPNYQGTLTELLQVFLDLCGKNRTLVMPAFFFGDRKYNYDILRYFKEHHEFYVDRVPSQMGVLSEMFRLYPEVETSAHPTHRICALGPKAKELVANHHLCTTGCGQGSPFEKMAKTRTVIVGAGIRYYRCLTQSHSPEDILTEKGEYPTKFDLDNVKINLKYANGDELSNTLVIPDRSGFERKLHPFLRKLLTKEELYEWTFHGIPFFHTTAGKVQQALTKAANEGRSVFF